MQNLQNIFQKYKLVEESFCKREKSRIFEVFPEFFKGVQNFCFVSINQGFLFVVNSNGSWIIK